MNLFWGRIFIVSKYVCDKRIFVRSVNNRSINTILSTTSHFSLTGLFKKIYLKITAVNDLNTVPKN